MLRDEDVDFGWCGDLGEVVLRSEQRRTTRRVRRLGVELGCEETAADVSERLPSSGEKAELTDPLVDFASLARHGLEHRVGTQRVKVGSGVVERALLCETLQVRLGRELELARQGLHDLELSGVIVGDTEVEHPVEAAQRERTISNKLCRHYRASPEALTVRVEEERGRASLDDSSRQ